MNHSQPNRAAALHRLAEADAALASIHRAGESVVIGGTALALFDFDLRGQDVRPTEDIDVIVPGSPRDRDRVIDHLARLEIKPKLGDRPGRVRLPSDVPLDLIPSQAGHHAGLAWFADAVASARRIPGLSMGVVSPTIFVALKLVALSDPDRGLSRIGPFNPGYQHGSSDLEDVVVVLDGLESVRAEIQHADSAVARYARFELAHRLRDRKDGVELVQGCLPGDDASQRRALKLWAWLLALPA